MKTKVLIAAFLAMFVATLPVLAQGNGNGGGNGASGQSDNGNAGNSENGKGGGGNSGNAGNGNNGNGNGNGNNGGGNGASANTRSSTPDDVTVVPEEDLLSIVKSGQAVSLASLLPNVQQRTGGEIIDAQLVRVDRSLIYVVKVLTPDGRVGVEYYDAHSGTHIEAR